MEEKNVLTRLDIRSTWSTAYKAVTAIWWIIVAIVTLIGTFGMSESYEYHGTKGEKIYFLFFEISYEYDYTSYTGQTHHYEGFWPEYIFVGIAILAAAVLIPVIIKKLMQFIANRCSLTLEEKQLVGQLKLAFSKKSIQMPIEKLDNIFTTKGIGDAFRGGETVAIHSASGVVKFHYVHNAKEFAEAALKQIEKYKKSVSSAQAAPVQVIQKDNGSLSDKIAELQKLKDQGIISDEQFEAKKQSLIDNFM